MTQDPKTFTERDIQIYLRACSDAAQIATKTRKGSTAALAIKQHILNTQLMAERAKQNGAFN